jgi:hypothetical protein
LLLVHGRRMPVAGLGRCCISGGNVEIPKGNVESDSRAAYGGNVGGNYDLFLSYH